MPDRTIPTRLLAEATLVTGNPGKLAEARRLCEASRWQAAEIDLPEIQSLDIRQILGGQSDAEAFHRLRQRPIVVDETASGPGRSQRFSRCSGQMDAGMQLAPRESPKSAYELGQHSRNSPVFLALLHRGAHQIFAEGLDSLASLVLPPRGEDGFGWDPNLPAR